MNKKFLVLGLIFTFTLVLSGCRKNDVKEIVKSESSGEETIEDEKVNMETTTMMIEDNRVIVEENYHNSLNYDGTFLFREQYDLEGTYFYTYYRVDSKGNILNIYDDKIDNMEVFNKYGQSVVSLMREINVPGKSGLVAMFGIMDIDGNYIVEQASKILNPCDKFYVILNEEFDDFGSIGYKGKIINNNNETIIELPLIEDLEDVHFIGPNSAITSNYNNFIFSYDFFYHNNKIITHEGDTIELDIDVTDIEEISSNKDIVYIIKEKEAIIINKDGIANRITLSPDMKNIRIYSETAYSYYDANKKKSTFIFNGNEVNFGFEFEWYHFQLISEVDHPILVIRIDENINKIVTIKNGSVVDLSKEYYDMDQNFNKFGYIYAIETRENGEGGFYVLLNDKGEEVITKEAKIVYMTSNESNEILVRTDDNDEVRRKINWITEEIYDGEKLRETFLKNLSELRKADK